MVEHDTGGGRHKSVAEQTESGKNIYAALSDRGQMLHDAHVAATRFRARQDKHQGTVVTPSSMVITAVGGLLAGWGLAELIWRFLP